MLRNVVVLLCVLLTMPAFAGGPFDDSDDCDWDPWHPACQGTPGCELENLQCVVCTGGGGCHWYYETVCEGENGRYCLNDTDTAGLTSEELFPAFEETLQALSCVVPA